MIPAAIRQPSPAPRRVAAAGAGGRSNDMDDDIPSERWCDFPSVIQVFV
jgi:hypothetical protein